MWQLLTSILVVNRKQEGRTEMIKPNNPIKLMSISHIEENDKQRAAACMYTFESYLYQVWMGAKSVNSRRRVIITRSWPKIQPVIGA